MKWALKQTFLGQVSSFGSMRRLFILCLCLLLAGALVEAQLSGGGSSGSSGVPGKSFTNDSPTPVNGFTLFTSTCAISVAPQYFSLCSSPSCDFTSSNVLCKSPLLLSTGSKSCATPTHVGDWGVTTVLYGACCFENGNCNSLPFVTPWVVGASPSSLFPNSAVPSLIDARSVSIVRRSATEWIALFHFSSRSKLTRTTDGGLTWSTPFFISDLIPPNTLPSGVTLSNVDIDYPSLAIAPDKSVHLAFGARDHSTGMSSVYYVGCPATSACSSSGEWRNATRLFSPIFDEVGGKWKYALSEPKIVVDDTYVHIVFDDTQPESTTRLDGIFYRVCNRSTNCDSTGDFSSPGAPDILNGVNEGYPHSPSIAMDETGGLHVSYLDASGVFYSRFFPQQFSQPWTVAQLVISGSAFSPPSISSGSDRVMITTSGANVARIFLCDSDECTTAGTSLPDWDDVSEKFTALNGVSSPTALVGMLSPSDGKKMAVFLTGIVNGKRQVMGQYWDESTSISSGLRLLTLNAFDIGLLGISDSWGSFVATDGELSMVDLLVSPPTGQFVVSSNILDSTNDDPNVSNLSPTSGAWLNSSANPSNQPFSKDVSFSVQDDDPTDLLYASVFLSKTPGGEDFPLAKYANLSKPITGTSCSSSSFLNAVPCTINVSLFKPTLGLVVPNGSYFLVVKAYDSSGGVGVANSSQPIVVTASLTQLLVNNPKDADAWHKQNLSSQVLDFVAQDATFGLKLGLKAKVVNTNTDEEIDLGLVDVASYNDVESTCVKTTSDYSCDIPIGVPAGLPEGKYDLLLYVSEDGMDGVGKTVANMTMDYQSPHITGNSPSGNVSTFPKTISFSLADFSGIDMGKPIQVSINGAPASSSPSCTPSAGIVSSATCTLPVDASSLSLQGTSTSVSVSVSTTDGLGNNGQSSFGFTVGSSPSGGNPSDGGAGGGGGGGGSGGGSGSPIIPSIDDVVTQLPNGDIVINGTGIVIPSQVVDSFNHFSNRVVRSTSDLVEVVGPSAAAIFFGLCTLSGIASDIVFRRVFAKVVAENERQRQRVLRMVLGLIFFILPIFVGWQFSLAIGFIFVVLEVVFFIGAAYLFKILQYYETFGFKPIEAAK